MHGSSPGPWRSHSVLRFLVLGSVVLVLVPALVGSRFRGLSVPVFSDPGPHAGLHTRVRSPPPVLWSGAAPSHWLFLRLLRPMPESDWWMRVGWGHAGTESMWRKTYGSSDQWVRGVNAAAEGNRWCPTVVHETTDPQFNSGNVEQLVSDQIHVV